MGVEKDLIFFFFVCMRKNKKIFILLILVLLFVLFYCSVKFELSFVFCPVYEIFHLYCPGCGITRMIISILEFDFYQAFRYNSFLFIFSPFFLMCAIDELLILFKKKPFIVKKIPNFIWIILLCIAILFGIFRNIDGFEFLRPIDF